MRVAKKVVAQILRAGPGGCLLRVEVPVPPSTNNLFPTQKGTRRRFPSRAYQAWKREAYPIIGRLARPRAFPVEVWLTLAGAGVNRRRDVANIEKALTDALVACGVIPDDNLAHVVGNHQVFRPDDGPQRVVVEIFPKKD